MWYVIKYVKLKNNSICINLFQEKEKEVYRSVVPTPWAMLLSVLPQIILAEKSYIELGCLTIKTKGFLRKEVCISTQLNLFFYLFPNPTENFQSIQGVL